METQSGVRMEIDDEHPYGDLIKKFLVGQFPTTIPADRAAKLDLVTTAIVGNGTVRFGPTPEPESLVVVRDVIRRAIDRNGPIPILVPWGSKKPDGSLLDIAEVGALKQLDCLQKRVQRHHAPGVQLRLRIEDASGYYLYASEEGSKAAIDRYTKDLCTLMDILGLHFIKPVPENTLFSAWAYAQQAGEAAILMEAYLKATETSPPHGEQHRSAWLKLHDMVGIKGHIAQEQREFYYRLYRGLFPGLTQEEATRKLAQYLAGALVRNKIGGRGEDPSWLGRYIQVTFAPPVPGSPPGMVRHFLYYRALPTRMAHTPPWRAKGYLEMHGRVASPKISSWAGAPKDLTPCSVELRDNDKKVTITTDYRITD